MKMASTGEFINKVAVVTGASSGLGQAIAILFAKKGASVVLCGRDETRLKSSLDQCVEASGGIENRFISVAGDVTKAEVRRAIVGKAIDTFQRLDILVANAGVLKKMGQVTEEMFDEVFDVNVKSVFFLIQAALPHLEKSAGNIINVSSTASVVAIPGGPVYPMTKAALDHMTRCLALDLGPKGIRVNSVNPSFVPTRIVRDLGDDVDKIAQEVRQNAMTMQLLKDECVTPEAVAEMVAFLASDSAKFITGQCHFVDAGRTFSGSGNVLSTK